MEHVQEISKEARPYLASALKHFGDGEAAVHKAQVVKARVDGSEFVLLWDRGKNGIAKSSVSRAELKRARVPKVKAEQKTAPPPADKE